MDYSGYVLQAVKHHLKANEKEVEKELAEMLKHCPDKQGGPHYKV
jgi:hypothetical protein